MAHPHSLLDRTSVITTMPPLKKKGQRGGKGGGGGRRGIVDAIGDDDTIANLKDQIKTLQDKASDVNLLQQHVLELEKENKHVRKMARNGNIMKFQENDVALIVEMTKRLIYPKCQYINSEKS